MTVHESALALPAMIRRIFCLIVLFCLLGLCSACVSYRTVHHEGRLKESLDHQAGESTSLEDRCPPLSQGVYVVQAGVFKMIANAQALRKRLEERGYPSSLAVSGFEEEKRVFRVLVGRFADMKEAQRFAEDIKTREKIDAIAIVKPPRDTYVVQAGCFREISAAKALRKMIADRGHNAYIVLSGMGSHARYNVVLGEFLDREEAEKASREISEKEHIDVFVNTL